MTNEKVAKRTEHCFACFFYKNISDKSGDIRTLTFDQIILNDCKNELEVKEEILKEYNNQAFIDTVYFKDEELINPNSANKDNYKEIVFSDDERSKNPNTVWCKITNMNQKTQDVNDFIIKKVSED